MVWICCTLFYYDKASYILESFQIEFDLVTLDASDVLNNMFICFMVKSLNCCWGKWCSVWVCNSDQTFGAVVVLVELMVLALLLPAEQVVGVVSIRGHRWRPPHHQLWWRVRVCTNVYRHWGCWRKTTKHLFSKQM